MAIEYSFSRVEANCVCKAGDPDEGKVCEVIVGMTAVDGETSAYIDATVALTGDARKAAGDLIHPSLLVLPGLRGANF